jgi:hypothetical protein
MYQLGSCPVFTAIRYHPVTSSESLIIRLAIHINAESITFENPKITVSWLDFC